MREEEIREIGYIDYFYRGIGKVVGLPKVFLHEVLKWEDGVEAGLVIGFNRDYVEVLFFEEELDLKKPVFRSHELFKIKTGKGYLGRIVDGFGRPIDNLGKIENLEKKSPVFKEAPGIIDREPVDYPLSTGIKIIDSVLPIGRGQRELIVGDRKIGKTTLALDSFINQKNASPSVYGVYVIIGQKRDKAAEIIQKIKDFSVLNSSVIVVALADSPLLEQYLAPYVGCTIAEYFRDNGEDALIVYDDLTKHAKAYREISLLLERPPGREAYPGDIFYLHSTLLERAAKLSKEKGGGSLTALPIIETLENDITAFIPTNLISITDGQIYLSPDLFSENFLPAIDIGLSVSRVGSQAQPENLRKVTKSLKLIISQYKALKKLIQLESTISAEAGKKFKKGALLMEALKQRKHSLLSESEEVVIFYGLINDLFPLRPEEWEEFETNFLTFLRKEKNLLLEKIKREKLEVVEKEIRNTIKEFLSLNLNKK